MYLLLLFLHFIGLALGVGTSFATLTLGLSTSDMVPAERVPFMLRAMAIAKNGSIGLTLLLVSGVGMLLMRGVHETFAAAGPAFHAKLGLVGVLVGLFGWMQMLSARAKREGGGPAMAMLPKVGRALLLISVAIVACAVAAFQ